MTRSSLHIAPLADGEGGELHDQYVRSIEVESTAELLLSVRMTVLILVLILERSDTQTFKNSTRSGIHGEPHAAQNSASSSRFFHCLSRDDRSKAYLESSVHTHPVSQSLLCPNRVHRSINARALHYFLNFRFVHTDCEFDGSSSYPCRRALLNSMTGTGEAKSEFNW